MADRQTLIHIGDYFTARLETYGATHQAVDYNSAESQKIRFQQLIKVVDASRKYSLFDFGSGYGGMYDYLLELGHRLQYVGYDIAQPMVDKGRALHPNDDDCRFTTDIKEIPALDYAVVSGTFNVKLDTTNEAWTKTVLEALEQMNARASRGLAFNMLTSYSDADRMRPDLYYADPLLFFDHCKRNFSKNVALLHDYKLYDFTILVRKDI